MFVVAPIKHKILEEVKRCRNLFKLSSTMQMTIHITKNIQLNLKRIFLESSTFFMQYDYFAVETSKVTFTFDDFSFRLCRASKRLENALKHFIGECKMLRRALCRSIKRLPFFSCSVPRHVLINHNPLISHERIADREIKENLRAPLINS